MSARLLASIALAFPLLAFALSASDAPTAALEVSVRGLRNDAGSVRIALFTSAKGYPEQFTLAAVTRSKKAAAPSQTVTFQNLAPGTYALSLLHDENDNKKLDRNFLGVPTEGIGASNDATNTLGPPKFEDARFELGTGKTGLVVRVHYWL